MSNFIEEIIINDLKTGKYKNIVLRFPPEPNGYLHIGHAKAILLNYSLAKKYNGICNLRFDDTNPSTEDNEYVKAIVEDMKWLGWNGDIFFASDYFDIMLQAAIRLIKKGKAYVDTTSYEGIKLMRGDLNTKGTDSACRNFSVEKNLSLFQDMQLGKFENGEAVLRAKIDMSSPNMNMRDPVLYRVLNIAHHRKGDKYKVYPLYDFAHPIEDAIENVTHSCCSLEFENHRPLYDWVLAESGEWGSIPQQYEFARLNISGINLSKRELKKLVVDKLVSGWDDPRMPTLKGFRRRGYTASSLWDFCDKIGVAKSNSIVDIKMLESCIRDELNLTAKRVMVAIDPVELFIVNRSDKWKETVNFETVINSQVVASEKIEISNKIFIDRADFSIDPPPKYKRMQKNGNIRLKSAYIVHCEDYKLDKDGRVIQVLCSIIENSKSGEDISGVKASGVIHWVNSQSAVDIIVQQFNNLLDEQGVFNKKSVIRINAKMDKYALTHSGPFQFLRNGFYCKDACSSPKNLIFNQTVGLKDGYK
ncbi:MAG: glutamine--tRNA ligase [Clostridiales bacterium]|jgi:glutaminyl-tRNA synthetase|nr:glutamine--tRNA ligase [Clostridiales bacterium]